MDNRSTHRCRNLPGTRPLTPFEAAQTVVLAIVTVSAFAGTAQAQCATPPGSPVEDLFHSDTVYPQERGETQVEISPSFQSDQRAQSTALGLAGQHGLTDSWVLEVAWEGPARISESGVRTWEFGDFAVGPKRVFMCLGRSRFHLAAGVEVEVPGGEGTDRRLRLSPGVILARDVPAINGHILTSFAVSAPVGRRPTAGGTAVPADGFGTGVEWSVGMYIYAGPFRPSGEFALTSNPGARADLHLTPALIWHSSPWEISIGAPIPLTRDAARTIELHFVYEFGGPPDGP